jgi:hypothetical protein
MPNNIRMGPSAIFIGQTPSRMLFVPTGMPGYVRTIQNDFCPAESQKFWSNGSESAFTVLALIRSNSWDWYTVEFVRMAQTDTVYEYISQEKAPTRRTGTGKSEPVQFII